jgi:hypothetical protein
VGEYGGEEVEEEAKVSGYFDRQKFTDILTLKLPTFYMWKCSILKHASCRIVAAKPVVAVRCTRREQSACLSWAKAVHDIKISGHVTAFGKCDRTNSRQSTNSRPSDILGSCAKVTDSHFD